MTDSAQFLALLRGNTYQGIDIGASDAIIERITKASPTGDISRAIGNSFYGLNHLQTPPPIPINRDYYGYTFFTRPLLNLSTQNIRSHRIFNYLLSNNQSSIGAIIRCWLDPRLAEQGITSQFVDRQQAFIPILSNHLLSISGWPDVIAPTMTSHEGVKKEAFSMIDGTTRNFSVYNLTANFRNIPNDPITLLFFYWIVYASLVYEGVLVPYPDFIINNEIDYQSRVYRLAMDSTKRYVTKIAACGAAFPLNSPLSNTFNFEHDRPRNDSNDQISISFQAIGADYQDPILIKEFNAVTEMYNDQFKDGNRDSFFKKLTHGDLILFNNSAYPRINTNTQELEWWVTNEDYARVFPSS